jgi:hypothetical protein
MCNLIHIVISKNVNKLISFLYAMFKHRALKACGEMEAKSHTFLTEEFQASTALRPGEYPALNL